MVQPQHGSQSHTSEYRDYDPPLPSSDFLGRYGARVLDPHQSLQLVGQPPLRNTAYVADRLLIPADPGPEMREAIERAAYELGYALVRDEGDVAPWSRTNVTRIVPAGDRPVQPPDAWSVLQWARSIAGNDQVLAGVGLDHLLFASVGIIGVPYRSRRRTDASPPPVAAPPAASPPDARPPEVPDRTEPVREETLIEEYGRRGTGGRQAVAWLGPRPSRHSDESLNTRRPVVAILDNGCGNHPWLQDVVLTTTMIDGRDIAPSDAVGGPLEGDPFDDVTDAVAGHGTFMAGLVLMACPDVEIMSIRVVNPDGVVVESKLMAALADLLELVRRDREGAPGGQAIDVLVLSMGYYPELNDTSYDSALASCLNEFGRLGVIVVTAAGNDGTSRPMYPAALAPHPGGPAVTSDRVPLVSVGASNPDGSAALFSNVGPWVTVWRTGAAVVSTMPQTFRGGSQAVFSTSHDGLQRSAIDPDNYQSGFAVWSGTSFAAPSFAGMLAQALLDGSGFGDNAFGLDQRDAAGAVMRGQTAVAQFTTLAGA